MNPWTASSEGPSSKPPGTIRRPPGRFLFQFIYPIRDDRSNLKVDIMSKRVIETSGDDAKATARHAKIAKEKEQAEEEEKNRASNEYWKVRRANETRKEEIKKLPKEEQAEAKKKLREDAKKNKEMYRREKKKAREEEREQRKAEKAEAKKFKAVAVASEKVEEAKEMAEEASEALVEEPVADAPVETPAEEAVDAPASEEAPAEESSEKKE